MERTIFAALVFLCTSSAFASVFVDQQADDSHNTARGVDGSLWQSWTPGWSGNLARVELKLGTMQVMTTPKHRANFNRQTCSTTMGQLSIYEGQSPSAPSTLLHTQLVTTTCESANCTKKTCIFAPACSLAACLAWQSIPLSGSQGPTSIPVRNDKVYTLHFEFTNSELEHLFSSYKIDFKIAAASSQHIDYFRSTFSKPFVFPLMYTCT